MWLCCTGLRRPACGGGAVYRGAKPMRVREQMNLSECCGCTRSHQALYTIHSWITTISFAIFSGLFRGVEGNCSFTIEPIDVMIWLARDRRCSHSGQMKPASVEVGFCVGHSYR